MVKAKHTRLGRTMRLWLTTLMSALLLSACASNKYQRISDNELQRYYGIYDAFCGLNADLKVIFDNIEIDYYKKKTKIRGTVMDAHTKEPIANAGVSITEYGDHLHKGITKEFVATNRQGNFEIESDSISHDDRLDIGMIGYFTIYYRIGELLHSESP